jgi:membrane-associated phospholipid phosphatase
MLRNRKDIGLTPVDVTTLTYMGTTGLLAIIFAGRLDGVAWHLLVRMVFVTIIFWLVFKSRQGTHPLINFLRYFYPLIFLTYFYSETDYFNNLFLSNLDPYFALCEQKLFGIQPSISFCQTFHWRWFAELMYFGYFSYYILILTLTLWVYFHQRDSFNEVSNAIYTTFYIFYLIFIILPVAGPQFYFPADETTLPQGYLFGALVKLAHAIGERPTAAFPSSHVGIMVVLWWMSFKHARPLLIYFIFIGGILCISTVYIKAHYLIDVLTAFVVSPFLLILSQCIYKRLK